MELKWLSKEKTKLEFELIGEDHTFCNAIRRELWEQGDINLAAYNIQHPLVSEPVILVETNKEDAKKVLQDSVDSLRKRMKELKDAFSKSK